MKIIVSNNIRIQDPDRRIEDYAEENLVMKNPDYFRNQRLGYSNYKTPQYLVFYEINGNELILPFGCLTDLFTMYPLEVFENRIVLGKNLTYKSNIKLFDYQEKVCKKAILRKNGVIVMPAGSGKTQTALEIIARLKYNLNYSIEHNTESIRADGWRFFDMSWTTSIKIKISDIEIKKFTYTPHPNITKKDIYKTILRYINSKPISYFIKLDKKLEDLKKHNKELDDKKLNLEEELKKII